jgi:hypothetical protein
MLFAIVYNPESILSVIEISTECGFAKPDARPSSGAIHSVQQLTSARNDNSDEQRTSDWKKTTVCDGRRTGKAPKVGT